MIYQIKTKVNGKIQVDEATGIRELHIMLNRYQAQDINVLSVRRLTARQPLLRQLMALVLQ
jgi:hypothetical protein